MAEAIESTLLPQAIRDRYLRYALSVIKERALPDVRDGLKPGQRRILYAMDQDLRVRAGEPRVKSVKVVGSVMGNYHPHGDASIYDAMVRLSQDWVMRYPLVDGQGNFGAITGDSQAAARYTEARLQPFAGELLRQIKENTVDLKPNFDDSKQEPVVLPARVPHILLNGSSGIAVGMATNIPPHNFGEVVKATTLLIDKEKVPAKQDVVSVAQLLRSLKGPDFPTGGEVVTTREDLKKAYETGKGTVKVRGTYRVEERKTEGQRVARTFVVIDSIPYGTTTGNLVARIHEQIEKKKLPGIASISDLTAQQTAAEGVHIDMELERNVDPEPLMAAIYRLTPLESTFGINLTCLLPPHRPETTDLKTLLLAWLDFRFETVTRALEYEKGKLEARLHILEGLLKVLTDVDRAIKLIRQSEDRADAQQKLMKSKVFQLSEAQADAVLEIQLYRLAKLETGKLEQEKKDKTRRLNQIKKLLAKDEPRWKVIKQELEELAKTYGDKRRSKILLDGGEDAPDYDPTALINEEDTHVILSAQGRLKRIKNVEDPERIRVREGDALQAVVQGSTLAHVCFFTNRGTAYTMRIHDVPATSGFGDPIQKHFNFKDGEVVVSAVSFDPRLLGDPERQQLFVATAGGNVLRMSLAGFLEASTRSGRRCVKLSGADDALVAAEVVPLKPRQGDRDHVILVTSKANGIRFPLAEAPELSGVGKGKRGIKLAKKELVVGGTTRERLQLETTRGATDKVRQKDLGVDGIGGPSVEIKQRGGYRRALPPPIELYELGENA